MRLDQEDTSAFNTFLKSVRYSHTFKILTQNVLITQNGSLVNVFDPGSGTYNVTLPSAESGRFYVVANVGAVSFNGTVNVLSSNLGPPTQVPMTFDVATAVNVTLSGGNLVATSATTNADTGVMVGASGQKTSGKWYYEITLSTVDGGFHEGIGICTSTSALTTGGAQSGVVGASVNTANSDSGQIFANGVQVGTMAAQGNSGDVWGIAVDLDSRNIWFRVKKYNLGAFGNWNNSGTANPVTNVGGFAIPVGAMVPFVKMGGFGGGGAVYTANFGATAFTGAVPTGFSSGWKQSVPDSGIVTALAPAHATLLFATDDGRWFGVTAPLDLNVFGYTGPDHSVGLVPDPGIGPADSNPANRRFLSELGWSTVAGLSASNAYFRDYKGGAVTLTPTGTEILEFLTAASGGATTNAALTVLASSATTPKSVQFALNALNVDHNALLNYSADRHIAHSGVTLTAGLGIAGGGDITASRTFDFAPTELTVATPTLGDYVVWDLNAGGPRKTLLTTLNGVLNHNALLNYVPNQHIDHSAVSIVASTGLVGGGDITTSRSISLAIGTLGVDVPTPGDSIPFYDSSDNDTNRAAVTSFNAILDHNALLNYVPSQHVDHTLVSIATTNGIQGGGTIAATRTLSLDNPVNTTTYGRKAATWQPLPNITVSNVAPSSPAVNDVWIDTT